MIKSVTGINNGINYTNIENIQRFYDIVISDYFDEINENNFTKPSILRNAVKKYATNSDNAKSEYGPIELWEVSNITNMTSMFRDCHKFNQDIGKWNVSNVTNMARMFKDCHEFNQDIGRWNVSKVILMEEMFKDCKISDEYKPKI